MRTDPGPVRSVLVYSMEAVIGDGLIKLPFLGALRHAFPEARIAWCAAKGSTVYAGALAPVVRGLIDEVVTAPSNGAARWDWLTARRPFGGRRFDVVIDTQTNPARSLVARRAAERVFVSAALGGRLSDRRLEALPAHVVERLCALLGAAAGRPTPPRPVPVQDQRALQAAEALLPAGPEYVGFAPGAGGESKRWPLGRYLELAARQAARGRRPAFFLGPQEADQLAAIRAAVPDVLAPEVERSDAFQDVRGPLLAIALAGRLQAAAANDAGPGHMLAAGGAPLLSLQQSRRKAAKFRPAAQRLEMLVAEDFGEGGMAAVPVDAADAALERLLSGR